VDAPLVLRYRLGWPWPWWWWTATCAGFAPSGRDGGGGYCLEEEEEGKVGFGAAGVCLRGGHGSRWMERKGRRGARELLLYLIWVVAHV
jgi:hypothetical protein